MKTGEPKNRLGCREREWDKFRITTCPHTAVRSDVEAKWKSRAVWSSPFTVSLASRTLNWRLERRRPAAGPAFDNAGSTSLAHCAVLFWHILCKQEPTKQEIFTQGWVNIDPTSGEYILFAGDLAGRSLWAVNLPWRSLRGRGLLYSFYPKK